MVARRVGDGAVLVHLSSNHVFELNATGRRVWELLAAGQPQATIVTTLIAEFDIDEAGATEGVTSLLAELDARGLVTR